MATFHAGFVVLAYLVLGFFGLGTAGDFAKFMVRGLPALDDGDRRFGRRLVAAGTFALVWLFIWAVWMVSGIGGCI